MSSCVDDRILVMLVSTFNLSLIVGLDMVELIGDVFLFWSGMSSSGSGCF